MSRSPRPADSRPATRVVSPAIALALLSSSLAVGAAEVDAPAGARFKRRTASMLDQIDVQAAAPRADYPALQSSAATRTDTALRDIDGLVALGILARDAGGGRSTSYSLIAVRASK